jgi:hypothetical protein
MITYILLGEAKQLPSFGDIMKLPLAEPTFEAVYEARLSAINQVTTEYFSLFDGGEDKITLDFDFVVKGMIQDLDESGLDIASARETINGMHIRGNTSYMHHGVICRTEAVKKLNLPPTGFIQIESAIYPALSKRGIILRNKEIYNWIPGGTSSWKNLTWARANGYRLSNGEEILPVPRHLQE